VHFSTENWPYHTSHDSVSVVRTTLKVYGKRQTLILSQPKTPEPIVTKFEWRDYVVDDYHQKIGLNPPRGFCSPYKWNIHPSCSKFTTFFWFLNSPTGESVRPIFTFNTSNDAVLCKEVPFYWYKLKILFCTYLFEKFETIAMAPMGKIGLYKCNSLNCHHFGCVQDRVVIFGSIGYSFRERPN